MIFDSSFIWNVTLSMQKFEADDWYFPMWIVLHSGHYCAWSPWLHTVTQSDSLDCPYHYTVSISRHCSTLMCQEYFQYVRKNMLHRWTNEFVKWAVYLIIIFKVRYKRYGSQYDIGLICFLICPFQDQIARLRNITPRLTATPRGVSTPPPPIYSLCYRKFWEISL